MLKLDAIWQADTQQAHFRLLLEAMSRPGRIYTLHTPCDRAALAVLATVLDARVTLADPHRYLHPEDWLMLECAREAPGAADYILCRGEHPPAFEPRLGTLPEPEHSATLVIALDGLGQGDTRLRLRGPGIEHTQALSLDGLDPHWLNKRDDWVGAFPLGVDMILVDEKRIAALPRTTRIEVC